MQLAKPVVISVPLLVGVATFALLQTRCVHSQVVQEKQGIRFATYNIQWLHDKITKEREDNIRSVIKNLNADVIALQEIQGRKALERIFDKEWSLGIIDIPNESQELAIAVKKPLKLVGEPRLVFPGASLDYAFPGERDVLEAMVETENGFRIAFYVVHMKSRGGSGGRMGTDSQRIMACGLLAAYIRAKNMENVVVLGDFNDTPDDVSVKILQTGNLLVSGGLDESKDAFLVNLCSPLVKEDYVTLGMQELYRGVAIPPIVRGARLENEKWRGKQYRYPHDLAVTQILFDQILVSKSLAAVQVNRAGVYSGEDAMRGMPGQVRREDSGYVNYQREGSLASDHLPVYADFRISIR